MSFALVVAGIAAASGLAQVGIGLGKRKKAKDKRKRKKQKLKEAMEEYKNLDTSNPYLGMENPYEDMQVNLEAAEFQRDQAQQAQADTLAGLQEQAGSSGVGALAQAIQQSSQKQQQAAQAQIANQEAAINRAKAGASLDISKMEAQGEYLSRQMEADKQATLLGMAQGEFNQAQGQLNDANQMIMSGIGTTLNAATSYLAPGAGMAKKGKVKK